MQSFGVFLKSDPAQYVLIISFDPGWSYTEKQKKKSATTTKKDKKQLYGLLTNTCYFEFTWLKQPLGTLEEPCSGLWGAEGVTAQRVTDASRLWQKQLQALSFEYHCTSKYVAEKWARVLCVSINSSPSSDFRKKKYVTHWNLWDFC